MTFVSINVFMASLVTIQLTCAFFNVHLLLITLVIRQMVVVFSFVLKVYGRKLVTDYVFHNAQVLSMLIISRDVAYQIAHRVKLLMQMILQIDV